MSSFLNNIINRHKQSAPIVQPRSRSFFETPKYQLSEDFSSPPEINENSKYPEKKSMERKSKLNHGNKLNEFKDSPEMPIPFRKPLVEKAGREKNNHKKSSTDTLKKRKNRDKATITEGNSEPKPMFENKLLQKQDKGVTTSLGSRKNKQFVNLKNKITENEIKGSNKTIAKQQPKPTSSILNRILENQNQSERSRFPEFLFNVQQDNRMGFVEHTPKTPPIPTVQIHIGRIEIKAVKQNTQNRQPRPKANKQGNSLEQFLKKREGKSS